MSQNPLSVSAAAKTGFRRASRGFAIREWLCIGTKAAARNTAGRREILQINFLTHVILLWFNLIHYSSVVNLDMCYPVVVHFDMFYPIVVHFDMCHSVVVQFGT